MKCVIWPWRDTGRRPRAGCPPRSTPPSGAGWIVQSRDEINLSAGRGVAIREFKLASGYGFADYLFFVDSKPVGVLEAKPEGFTLTKSVAGIKSVLRRSQERRALCRVNGIS